MTVFELFKSGQVPLFCFEGGGKQVKTAETVDALLRPTVSRMGYFLDEVEFKKEQGNWVLTLYIEHEDGSSASIDDCEAVSRAVDSILDEADPIEQAYYLSVSSIGIDRPLKKDRDFERSLGTKITVKLYAPLNGCKEFTGTLIRFDADSFTVELECGPLTIARKDAASIKPYIDFNSFANIEEIEDTEKEEN